MGGCDRSLLLSRLLDLHLGRSIERENRMNKFQELANGIKQDQANFNDQADELLKKREELRQRGERVFARHRDHHKEVDAGLQALEAVVNDLEGSNSKNGEDSERSSETFRTGESGQKT